jgi:hypothetical protein
MTLAFYLGLRLFGDIWRALALAALWGLHPVPTESVTNVVGRADLLAAFGVLAGRCVTSVRARGSGRGWRGWRLWRLSACSRKGERRGAIGSDG